MGYPEHDSHIKEIDGFLLMSASMHRSAYTYRIPIHHKAIHQQPDQFRAFRCVLCLDPVEFSFPQTFDSRVDLDLYLFVEVIVRPMQCW